MSAPQHDPELFDELMRTELRRQPVSRFAIATLVSGLVGGLLAPVFGFLALGQIKRHRQRGRVLVICGLAAFAGWTGLLTYQVVTGTAWWQQPRQALLQESPGSDLVVNDCFTSPETSGEVNVVRRSCTEPHNGEAYEVLQLGDGPMPEVLEIYQHSLARCQADARAFAVSASPDLRIQVMTPTSYTWKDGKHHAICYFHFGTNVTQPARMLKP